MVWVWLRRAVQIACLALFILLLTRATYPVRSSLPPQLFLQLDPLSAATAALSGNRLPVVIFYAALGTLAVTLLLGRVFCGFICPLGTCLDLGDRLLWSKRKPGRAAAAQPGLKFGLLAAVLGSALFGIQLGWFLDPIPLLTRAAALVLYPLVVMAQNLVVIHGRDSLRALQLYPEVWDPRHFQLSLVAAACLVGLLLLGSLSRRYWCRNLCPLGALLGLIGRFGLIKRAVNESCVGCRLCVRDCKMGAIPAEDPTTTKLAECILCFGCISCKQAGPTTFCLAWRPAGARREVDIARRRTFQALGGGVVYGLAASTMLGRREHHQKLIRPPGAILRKRGRPDPMPENQFRELCVRCGECMKACVTGGLQPAVAEADWDGVFTPVLKPKIGWCERACTACGEVCPTSALRPFTAEEKTDIKIGLATIDANKCLAWQKGKYYKLCLVCDEQCSYDAVKWIEEGGVKRPVVDADVCTGCGICEAKCPVQPEAAIVVNRSEMTQ
ncbi:MAG: 4Fe-4S binding protein [Armatimonadetes bacterium]|nr:4Fe-4S binding protein [Armatimonadota bacterium]